LLFGMSLGASFAFGQSADGNVVGAVFDTSGQAVPAAEVELASNATGVKATTKTGPGVRPNKSFWHWFSES
jgi:hypothetical protein